jgi:hypothetical protein
MATKTRFASLSADEITEIESNQDSTNTKKVVDKAVRVFRSFLTEKEMNVDFETGYSVRELDGALRSFYANARTLKGKMYKMASFIQLNYGLHKYLLTKGTDTSGEEFQVSNETFKAMKKELTKIGKGDVKHRSAISDIDLRKL